MIASTRWLISDSLVLARRNIEHVRQIPEKLLDVTIQPLMFVVLFAYVFGGVIGIPDGSYHEYLIGGILAQTITFGIVGPATSIATDLREGIVDRFRSLPINRSAYLLGHLTAELAAATLALAVLTVSGLIVDWRIHSSPLEALGGFALLMLYAMTMLWVGTLLGPVVRSPDSVTGIGIGGGRRIGTANRSEDYPTGGVIAPEDMHVGLPLNAHAPINVSYHTINVEDTPQLRELWVNFWYRDASEVTEPALEWFRIGDPLFTIAPLATATLGPYTCNVGAPGRLLWLYGHRHANNTRFTVTRTRGTQVDTIYDADKWEEPLLLEYSTSVTNTAPDIAQGVEGGWNGILDLAVGDVITWKCDVTNKNNATLRFTNNTFTGEMCIIDAEAVGATCSGL